MNRDVASPAGPLLAGRVSPRTYPWRLYRCRGCHRDLPQDHRTAAHHPWWLRLLGRPGRPQLIRHVARDDHTICAHPGPHELVHDPQSAR